MKRETSMKIRALLAGILLLVFHAAVAASSKPMTPATSTEMEQAKAALATAREASTKAKAAWDKAKLETTLWDQRYKRAYKEWSQAKGEARKAALERRLTAEIDLKKSLEFRKVNWYRFEIASRRAKAAEESMKICELEQEMATVQARLDALKTPVVPKASGAVSAAPSTPTKVVEKPKAMSSPVAASPKRKAKPKPTATPDTEEAAPGEVLED